MTPHLHRDYVEGCFRCELSRDEVTAVTDEQFDELLAELDRPPKADPKLLALLRRTRETVVQCTCPAWDCAVHGDPGMG